MAGQILSLFAKPRNRDWSQQELAEFYRVESALVRSGLSVETDRGLTDEGEPWFVFCRCSDGEVVVHFAKCDGQYIVAGPGYERVAKGLDFTALVRDLVSRHPLVNTTARPGSNVVLHPTALLVAVVAAALLKDGEAQAKGLEPEGSLRSREVSSGEAGGSSYFNLGLSSSITIDVRHLAVVMAAIAVTLPITENESGSISQERLPLVPDSDIFKQARDSAGHAYGIELSLEEDRGRGAASQNSVANISPEQKLEVLSFTSILLDLSTKEIRSADVVTHDLALENQVGHEPSVANVPPASDDHFLRIELVKGSSQLPSIRAVAHHSGDETTAVPINLSSIQPFLDHALHLKGAASSAMDILEALISQGTIQHSLLDSLKNDLPKAELIPTLTSSDPTNDHAATAPSNHADHPDTVVDYHLPPEGYVADEQSITQAIKAFVSADGGFKILQDGHDLIFCSSQTLSASENTVRTITWDFEDGSSITLIGPPSHMPMELMA